MYDAGINPYTGDVYHENPLVLIASNALIKYVPALIPFLFVVADLLCAALLYQMSKIVTRNLVRLSHDHIKVILFIKIAFLVQSPAKEPFENSQGHRRITYQTGRHRRCSIFCSCCISAESLFSVELCRPNNHRL